MYFTWHHNQVLQKGLLGCYRRWKVHAAKHALSVPGPLESSPRIAGAIAVLNEFLS